PHSSFLMKKSKPHPFLSPFYHLLSPFCHPFVALLSPFCRPFVTLLSHPFITLFSPFCRPFVTPVFPIVRFFGCCHPCRPGAVCLESWSLGNGKPQKPSCYCQKPR